MDASPPDDPRACVRRLAQAARRKTQALAAELHPAWTTACWERMGVDAERAAGGRAARWSPVLGAFYKLQWPSPEAFRARGHRIVLLPRAEMLRVLAAIVLHGERGRVRLSIGPGTRATVIERIGEAAYAGMLEAPPPLQGARGALTAEELEPERLGAAGLARLVECGEWTNSRLLSWMRVSTEPAAAPVARARAQADARDALARLPTYFPEHAWLFGSPMDRALSDSTTA